MNFNGVRPKNQSEARIWNKYNGGSWDWTPIRYWPSDIARAVIGKNLSYNMRFRWYLYLVGNGMDPGHVRDVIKEELRSQGSNRNNLDHMDQLYNDLDKNQKKWSYWDEHHRKTMKIGDTYVGKNDAYVGHNMVIRRTVIRRKPFTGINDTREWLNRSVYGRKQEPKWDDGTYDQDEDDSDY